VPEVEEREAARFNGYTWRQWERLKRREQVDSVAYFRLTRLIDLHKDEAVAEEGERRAKVKRGA